LGKEGETRAGTGKLTGAETGNTEKQEGSKALSWPLARQAHYRTRAAEVSAGRRTKGPLMEMDVLKTSSIRVGIN